MSGGAGASLCGYEVFFFLRLPLFSLAILCSAVCRIASVCALRWASPALCMRAFLAV